MKQVGGRAMEFMTTRDTAIQWGLTNRMIQYYCKEGKIKGAFKIGTMWLVPKNAERPSDGRTKGKGKHNE